MDVRDLAEGEAAPVKPGMGRRKFADGRGLAKGATTPAATEIEALPDSGEPNSAAAVPPEVVENLMVDLAVELGRIKMRIREVRALRQGEVIGLQRPVGDPLDITINGRIIAKGEVVATEGHQYGIRITEIVAREAASGD